jgi:hypothetical protein
VAAARRAPRSRRGSLFGLGAIITGITQIVKGDTVSGITAIISGIGLFHAKDASIGLNQ